MADEKPRAPRARKKSEPEAVATKTVAKKKTGSTTRRRATVTLAAQPDDVAVRAYYLWEHGEPGDATEHWLRAEQEHAA